MKCKYNKDGFPVSWDKRESCSHFLILPSPIGPPLKNRRPPISVHHAFFNPGQNGNWEALLTLMTWFQLGGNALPCLFGTIAKYKTPLSTCPEQRGLWITKDYFKSSFLVLLKEETWFENADQLLFIRNRSKSQ